MTTPVPSGSYCTSCLAPIPEDQLQEFIYQDFICRECRVDAEVTE